MIEPRVSSSSVDVSDHYDELDDFYRQIWGEHLHHGLWTTGNESPEVAVTNLMEVVAEAAEIGRGTRVCDAGAGYGGTARYLSETHGADVTALTVSRRQYRYALSRRSGEDTVEYMLADWFDNAFADRSFDVVIAVESTAHMADKAGFFIEANRVLRPGGRLVVCAWLAAERRTDREVRYLLEPICREGRLPGLGTMSEYKQWIDAAGLELETCDDLSDRVRRTWSICFRRVVARFFRDSKYIRFLLDPSKKNRRFLLTLPRMWIAYRVGALRYGFFKLRKPE